MREIIALQIGQCGNQVGEQFWDTISQEHGLSPDGTFSGNVLQKQRLNVYFNESSTSRYVPRSINIDLEPGTLDTIKSGKMGSLFKPDSFIFGHGGAGNNWAKGHYTEGMDLCDDIMDLVRKEFENCDCPQGFQVTHSLGGGTGSGLGTLILTKLKDEYYDKIISTFSVVPSPSISETVVEPYNCTLSVHKLLDCSGITFCFDNEALYKITSNLLKEQRPSYQSLNTLISSVMSGITCSLRFPGQLNQDLRKLAVNMVPYQRLHFFSSSIAPLSSALAMKYESLSIQEVIQQLFDKKNMMVDLDPTQGKYLTANCIMRGKISTHDCEEQVYKLREKNTDSFIPWIPNNIQLSVCDVAPKGLNLGGTFIGNTTSIMDLFERVNKQFLAMYKKKAYLHLYEEEGMDEEEFNEAEGNLMDLINEYKQYDQAGVDAIDDGEEQEGEIQDTNAQPIEEAPAEQMEQA